MTARQALQASPDHFTGHARLRAPLRWLAAVLLVVAATVHIPLIAPHLDEAPACCSSRWRVACLLLALALVGLIHTGSRRSAPSP